MAMDGVEQGCLALTAIIKSTLGDNSLRMFSPFYTSIQRSNYELTKI